MPNTGARQRQRRNERREQACLAHLEGLRKKTGRVGCFCRYVCIRELGRLRRARGCKRKDCYDDLPAGACVVPGETVAEREKDRQTDRQM